MTKKNSELQDGDAYDGPLEDMDFIPDSGCPGCDYQAEVTQSRKVFREHDDRCPIATGRSKEWWALVDRCSDYPHLAADDIERLERELKRVGAPWHEREPPHCPTCGCGVEPSGEPHGSG